jgi:hypothetical protein
MRWSGLIQVQASGRAGFPVSIHTQDSVLRRAAGTIRIFFMTSWQNLLSAVESKGKELQTVS